MFLGKIEHQLSRIKNITFCWFLFLFEWIIPFNWSKSVWYRNQQQRLVVRFLLKDLSDTSNSFVVWYLLKFFYFYWDRLLIIVQPYEYFLNVTLTYVSAFSAIAMRNDNRINSIEIIIVSVKLLVYLTQHYGSDRDLRIIMNHTHRCEACHLGCTIHGWMKLTKTRWKKCRNEEKLLSYNNRTGL